MPDRLCLFGTPSLDDGATRWPLPFERRSQLVAWLALQPGWVPRTQVAALLWPDLAEAQANANLRKTLFRLQNAAWARAVEVQSRALRVVVDTDLAAFDTALAAGRRAEALALRRGELLLGFDDEANNAWTDWLRFERDRLRQRWRAAALEHLAGEVDVAGAEPLAAQLFADDPFDEAALQAWLACLVRHGDAGRAREVWNQFAERLQRELGLEPGAALRALFDGLTPGRSAAAAAHPPPTSSADGFVGRNTELQQLDALLDDPACRLVTVTGPGGIGKTRLVRELLARRGGSFVALEDVDDPKLLPGRIARAVGLALTGQADALAQVARALAASPRLLVLDNFEQLADAAPSVASLLESCPSLQIVVTSRVLTRLAGEHRFALQGLPCPEAEDEDRVESFDAARLFVRAARRVDPGLLPSSEAGAIAEICRAVDGLPLALELAAAWTRVLSCRAIADELRAGTTLLHEQDPTRPVRHASLAIVFEQSWARLGDVERDALARLSVFRGGFTAASARQVSGASLPVLAALTDRSLLTREGQRHRLHPLVQQLAEARLAQPAAAAEAHGRHFLDWVARLGPDLRRAKVEALAEVDADFENLRAAWHWACRTDRTDLLPAAAEALMRYCDHRGRWRDGMQLFESATAFEQRAPAVWAAVRARAAHLAHRLDRYAEAQAMAEQALAIAQGLRDAPTQRQAIAVLASNAYRAQRFDDAQRWFEKALRMARTMADPLAEAGALDNLALVAKARGRESESLDLAMQGVLKHRELGDAAGEAMALNNLSLQHLHRGDIATAQTLLEQARTLCRTHRLPTTQSLVEVNLADVAWRLGHHAAAERHADVALALSRAAGQRAIAVNAHQTRMRTRIAAGDLDAARRELTQAQQESIAIGRAELKAGCVYMFAELLAAQGDRDAAARVLAFAIESPTISAGLREPGRRQLAAWGAPATLPAWPALDMDALAHRIVVEAEQAYAPLLALLRASP